MALNYDVRNFDAKCKAKPTNSLYDKGEFFYEYNPYTCPAQVSIAEKHRVILGESK